MRRYRTQEVAGSSPASSIRKSLVRDQKVRSLGEAHIGQTGARRLRRARFRRKQGVPCERRQSAGDGS